jgi:hypothetical protein
MKKFTLLTVIVLLGLTTTAQQDSSTVVVTDTTKLPSTKNDTIRVGNILIIKKNKDDNNEGETAVKMGRSTSERKKQNSRVSTNWWVFDLGFSNYDDQTNYANTGSYLVNQPGSLPLQEGDFKLRSGKSINVNIWLFMQRMSLVKNYVNLKYGLGVELNNYRYKSALSYKENGVIPYSGGMQTSNAFIFRDSISFSKNKLAADYVTVPLMLNFNTNPHSSKKGLNISIGGSAGYLYSQRNKQVSDARGKEKNKGDYDLEKFKFSYIAELGLGPVKLYGTYSPTSFYENGLDMRPYTVGFRFSNW